ncbi:MAG TPA: kynureninase [Chitinophagaceae bacterium]|nr:kynureninase [Chitinophagaceae bacterium]
MDTHVGLSPQYKNTPEYARYLDEQDPLQSFREKFYIPIMHGREAIYFTGNSLGLQPRSTQDYVLNELEDWANYGVEGHLHARNPWLSYHELFPSLLKDIVGAKEHEVVVMNQLTVNLHLLLTSFYRPNKQRFKIICEAKAFPSDQYALDSQAALHGFDPAEAIIEVGPSPGRQDIDHEDIINAIQSHANELSLVMFSGVNYYTGQVFDMASICKAAHEAGALCGFDLAHAAGNVELQLHDWDVDFACWCSYKYLNSGPGGVAGAYIHERHAANTQLPRMAGWWGHDKEERFKMDRHFKAIPTAEGWQLSNAPILSMAAHKASLDIFAEAGMDRILHKGKQLNAYLQYILDDINAHQSEKVIDIITPRAEGMRGCQVSMLMLKDGKEIFQELGKKSVIADWREPNVIRVAPVPLYNRFEDVYRFGEILADML